MQGVRVAAAALVAVVAVSGCTHSTVHKAAPGVTTPVIAASAAPRPLASSATSANKPLSPTQARLLAIATAEAARDGGHPFTASAVLTKDGRAMPYLFGSSDPEHADADVWAIQMVGDFVCNYCGSPVPRPKGPSGHVIILLVAAHGSLPSGFGFSGQVRDLGRLGHVLPLRPT